MVSMERRGPPLATTTPSAVPALIKAAPDREYQELWFALARKNWKSVVLVPADEGLSAAGIATALAEVGRWLRTELVTLFIMSDPLDYASATQITAPTPASARAELPERTIVAVQPVVVEPLGLAVTQAADAVVLCIEMGRTRMSSTRRTIDLIGRDRIAGCFLIR